MKNSLRKPLPMGLLLLAAMVAPGGEQAGSRRHGPEVEKLARRPGTSPHEVLALMFQAIETAWVPTAYEDKTRVRFRASLNAALPGSVAGRGPKAAEEVAFDVTLDGNAAPNGRYRLNMEGELGKVEMVDDLHRKLLTSHDFRAFSDVPHRGRPTNANLANYRSYLLRHLASLRSQILESGSYRAVYAGTGIYDRQEVDVIRVYKPMARQNAPAKAPISLNRLWTFWQDGGYEIWIYRKVRLPVAVFYTNTRDNIHANFRFDYDERWLPRKIAYNNNSAGAVGAGDVILTFDQQKQVNGISLRYDGDDGVFVKLDATLDFLAGDVADVFRATPPFGFRKLNHDHLKIMVLTQISGGLLKLKQYGINIKNFKF